jgi:hypothetical protein
MSFETGTPVPSMGGAEVDLGAIIDVTTPDEDEAEEQ